MSGSVWAARRRRVRRIKRRRRRRVTRAAATTSSPRMSSQGRPRLARLSSCCAGDTTASSTSSPTTASPTSRRTNCSSRCSTGATCPRWFRMIGPAKTRPTPCARSARGVCARAASPSQRSRRVGRAFHSRPRAQAMLELTLEDWTASRADFMGRLALELGAHACAQEARARVVPSDEQDAALAGCAMQWPGRGAGGAAARPPRRGAASSSSCYGGASTQSSTSSATPTATAVPSPTCCASRSYRRAGSRRWTRTCSASSPTGHVRVKRGPVNQSTVKKQTLEPCWHEFRHARRL